MGQQIAPSTAASGNSFTVGASPSWRVAKPADNKSVDNGSASAVSSTASENSSQTKPVIYDEKSEILTAFSGMITSSPIISSCPQSQLLSDVAEYLNSTEPLWGLSPLHLKAIEEASAIPSLSDDDPCTLFSL